MYRSSQEERDRNKERIKGLFILSAFTIAIAVISLLVMDLVIIPVTLFAIHQKAAFNVAIKWGALSFLLFLLIYPFVKKIISLAKDGLKPGKIILHLLLKTLMYFTTFCVFLALTIVKVILIYFILDTNNYSLYKFISN
ncbi:MAG: hypothetical protein GY754_42685 [bacterium]|nr:hypothetical protein [bacterium]